MSILISGSVAYDTIFAYEGYFADHAQTMKLDGFNLTFQGKTMLRTFGGCAANIAMSLKACGGEPFIFTAVGIADAADYYQHLRAAGVRTDGIMSVDGAFTPHAFITTDLSGNQLTTFHEGAMKSAHHCYLSASEPITHGMITATAPHVMRAHTELLLTRGVPIIWDIGPALAYLTAEDCLWFLERTDILTCSNGEWSLLKTKTGLTDDALFTKLKVIIITLAADGCDFIIEGKRTRLDAIKRSTEHIPVGCGDAFRGGLLRGLELGWDWFKTIRLAQLMGAIKAQTPAAQIIGISKEEVAARFEAAYGAPITL